MIKITFPDKSVREYEQGITGLQIAESISPALARDVLACGVNGETVELNRPINEDSTVELYKWDDEQGKHAFWHTSAHLLAEAPCVHAGVQSAHMAYVRHSSDRRSQKYPPYLYDRSVQLSYYSPDLSFL